jgi:H+/Cl- antiporter ClcA
MIKIRSSFKWGILCLLISFLAGSTSALFLVLLDAVTLFRTKNNVLIALLPIAALITVILYQTVGRKSASGNHLIVATILQPSKPLIDWLMAPLILFTTLIAHLSGASVGREGTALQLSTSLSDQLTQPFKLNKSERAILLKAAVAAGFGAVFGTPLAGALFALEFVNMKFQFNKNIVPVFICGFLADQVCLWWGIQHTVYTINQLPAISFHTVFQILIAGIVFGLIAFLFKTGLSFTKELAIKLIPNDLWRGVLGGILIAAIIYFASLYKFAGLGIPSILNAYADTETPYAFFIKLSLTIISLSVGFKGGEVTPLFFIGATLGSSLSLIIPLPIPFLAGMGMVAVFGAASKTPLASALLAFELFGKEFIFYAFVISFIASFIAGKKSIYQSN